MVQEFDGMDLLLFDDMLEDEERMVRDISDISYRGGWAAHITFSRFLRNGEVRFRVEEADPDAHTRRQHKTKTSIKLLLHGSSPGGHLFFSRFSRSHPRTNLTPISVSLPRKLRVKS